ncbi:hypothetical protein BH09VER1_BH09VER1_56320 [soil metagenome]
MKKVLPWLFLALRLGLAGIFLWAGASKLRDPQSFAEGIATFRVFPISSLNLLALAVPILEMLTGILLLSPRWHRQAALLCGILSATFTLLFVWVVHHGWEVHCGCFGKEPNVAGNTLLGLLRAVSMMLVSGIVYIYSIFVQRE